MANSARFGLTLSNRGVLLGLTTPDELLEMAEAADSSGAFAHVWVGDQIMAKPRMESIVLMAGIAARHQVGEDRARLYGKFPLPAPNRAGLPVGQSGPTLQRPHDNGEPVWAFRSPKTSLESN